MTQRSKLIRNQSRQIRVQGVENQVEVADHRDRQNQHKVKNQFKAIKS